MSSTTNNDSNNAQHGPTAGGGGLFSRLRGQAEAALAKMPQYNEIQHYARQASVQANPRQSPHTLQSVLTIKACKGVIIDHDAVARETKNYSKNILDYARVESSAPGHDVADIQDVGDRVAFLIYKAGELHEQHAKRLEAARIAMKDIRNFENSINPQRDQRTVLEREIGKLRTSTKPDTNTNKRIESLQAELDALIAPNSALAKAELQAITLKRRMLAESFSMQFDSMQELGEKLAIISSHGKALIQGWDISPNTVGKSDYVSGAKTAAVRSSVEDAISSWDIRRPLVSPPNISAGEHGVARAPSFHQSHAGELASLHSVEDPAAAHKEALDSYYAQPASPGPGQGSISTSTTHGYDQSAGQRPAGSEYAHSHGQEHNSHPVGGNSSFSTSDHTTGSGNPFVQQLNNAPVTQLPAPVTASSTGGSYHTSPDLHPTRSNNSGSSPISIPVDTSPMSSTLAPAPSLPTVAETGAPISGTGGPAKGVLRSPDSTPADVSAAQSKQEEARQELNRRFDEYSGHAGGNNSTASGSGSGVNPFEDQSDQDYQTNLEKEISQRAHRGGESLPAYSAPSAGSSSDKPTQ